MIPLVMGAVLPAKPLGASVFWRSALSLCDLTADSCDVCLQYSTINNDSLN